MSVERRSPSHPLHPSLLALLLLAPLGCGPSPAPDAPPDATYTVRGEIAKLPTEGSNEVWIHHEAIPDFRDQKGETVGMESMTMPFPLGPQVAAGELAMGERVTFDFEVRWAGRGRPLAVTRIEPLTKGTKLAFDPPEADDAGGDATSDQVEESIPK